MRYIALVVVVHPRDRPEPPGLQPAVVYPGGDGIGVGCGFIGRK
jgi:hypothetical protein